MTRIKHIAIRTPDPEKTAAFYKEVFGLKEVGQARTGCYLSDGYINLAVLKSRDEGTAESPRDEPGYAGVHHFGFMVDDVDGRASRRRLWRPLVLRNQIPGPGQPGVRRHRDRVDHRVEAMSYRTISADCHIDMTWMPGDLWVKNAPARFRDLVPQVRQTPDGPRWYAEEKELGAVRVAVTARAGAAVTPSPRPRPRSRNPGGTGYGPRSRCWPEAPPGTPRGAPRPRLGNPRSS